MVASERQINIRQATTADAAEIMRLFHDTVQAVNSRDYSPMQLSAWTSPEKDALHWAARQDNRLVFVAEQVTQISGFAELEKSGHIDCFYCHKDFQRQGAGTALLHQIMETAEGIGAKRLLTEASTTALPFFLHHNFTVLSARKVVHRGIVFLNYKMTRPLPRAPK